MKFVETWTANVGGGGGGGGIHGQASSPEMVTIEWHMMDKSKFVPLSMVSSLSIRCFLYPFTVIKTRIQIQKRKTIYNGTFDAFRKTLRHEGISGLYKGFWVNTIQIASGVFYVMTYEGVRHFLAREAGIENGRLKALLAGAAASVVGQTIIVPFDVISQHMMVLGQPGSNASKGGPSIGHYSHMNNLEIDWHRVSRSKARKWDIAAEITRQIYRKDGIRGFYRGYCASLCAFVPNGALWWWFYHFYSDQLASYAPPWLPELVVRCVAAPLSGISASVMTNPLDIVRARFQVQRLDSYFGAFYVLWSEERMGIFTKGLSARLVQSCIFSFFLILGYETIKRMSLHDHYKDEVRW